MEENFQPKIIKYINLGHDIEFSSSFKKAQKELHILHFMENTTKEHIFLEFHEKYLYYFNIILRVVETYVILLQKVIFEYQEFYKDLIFWYGHNKVLINKSLLNSLTREELYSNINLDLVLDIKQEPFKNYLYTSKRVFNLLNTLGGSETPYDTIMYIYGRYDRELKDEMIKNYLVTFNKNPYKVIRILKVLYKKYERATILNYGLDYDIKVSKSSFIQYDKINNNIGNNLQDVDIIQYYFKNDVRENKRSSNYSEEFNEYLQEDLKLFLAHNLDVSSIYADDENRSRYWVKLKMLLSFTPKKDAYKLQLNNIFGGYTYWWSWHQDAFHIHGEKGSGGYSLFTEYVKKKRTLKQLSRTLWGMYIPQKKYTKLNYGTYVTVTTHGKWYNRYGVELSWDTKNKRKYLQHMSGGEFSWRLEKGYFRNFLISDDLWRERYIFNANKGDKEFVKQIWRRTWREANKGFLTFQPEKDYVYWNFKFNTPKVKNMSKWGRHWIGTLYDYPEIFHNKYLNPKKVYEYVLSEILPYLDVVEKRLDANSKFVRSYFMRKFYIDSYFEKDEMWLKRKINFNNISSSEFFTTIENVEENINLNFINKNFYGRHTIKNIDFHVGKDFGYSSTELPKSTKVLMKKVYIENLLTSYQKEENPIKKYIYIKYLSKPKMVMFFNVNKSKLFNIIKVSFFEFVTNYIEGLKILIEKFCEKSLEIRAVENYHNFFKRHNVYKNFVILLYFSFFGLLYSSICMFLMLLIRSNMPKNVIYGIARKDKLNWISHLKKQILHEVIINENTSYRDYGLQIKINQDKIEEKVKERWEYIILGKSLPLRTNHRAIMKTKNTFNMENRYIYRWSIRLGDDNKPLTNKYGIYWKQSKIQNSIRENINKEFRKTYDIFYKALKFEKNLEKWEDNTKVRLDFDTWINYFFEQGYIFPTIFSRVVAIFYRDSNFNHNRKIFWEDSSVDEFGQIVLYYKLSKTITNVLFIFRFFFGIVQTWSIWHWRQRFYQMIHHGVNARLSLRALRKNLENVWSIKWYGDNLDFNINMVYSNWLQIKKQVDDIKNTQSESEKLEKKRIELVSKIVKSVLKKQNNMIKFNQFINDIHKKRKFARFDIKLENLKNKFKVNCGNIAADKAAAEQKIMYEFRHEIEVFKLELDMAEINLLTANDNFFTWERKDWDDKTNSLAVFDNDKWAKSNLRQEKKLWATHYERVLREKNFKDNVIDRALDKKDRPFFERIRAYNEKLSDAWLAIDLQYKQMEAHESAYVRFNRKLNNNDLDDSYIWYRKYATMGTRFYYILNLVLTFFAIWTEHLKKIRKSEFSVGSLILMIKLDFKEYIYITYWEYIVIWERYKAFKKLGYSIIDIFKFSLIILMPLVFLGSGLYLILGLFYVLIKIKEKKISKKIFNILKKVWNIIKKIVNKLNIFLIFFKDIKTGEITINNVYFFFMSFCGFVQRNIYFIKGAFIIGYKQKGIVFGLKKVCEYFFYKYKKNKNIIIKKIRSVLKKLINMKLSWKIIIEKIKKLIFKKKESVMIKLDIIKTKWDLEYSWERIHWKLAIKFYKNFLDIFWGIDFKDFVNVYKIFLKDCNDAYIDKWLSKELKNAINELSWKEKVILIIKYLVNLVKIPGRLLLNIWWLRYIKSYKQRGLRPKQYNKYLEATLGWQLHRILKDKAVSNILFNLEYNYSSLLELFILYKNADERAKTVYQVQYWRWVEWRFTSWKEYIFAKLREPVESLEDYYNNFERGSQYDTWSFWKRAWYSYWYYKKRRQQDDGYIREQKNLSRDIFFYKKTIIRDRLIRIYFIKGLINWITYVYMKKVVFTQINPLKNEIIDKKYKGLKFNYKINDIGEDYHIGTFLKDVPPQFWSLAIIYNIYMQNIYRYFLTDETYPVKWNNNMAYSRDIKWRLGLPNKNKAKMGLMDKYRLAAYNLRYDPLEFAYHVDAPGYNPMLRWALFLLEFGMTYEDIDEDDEYDENATWGDISLPHLLTYNESLDQLRYEVREYTRIIAKTNIFGKDKNEQKAAERIKYEMERVELLWQMLGMKSKKVENRLKFERSLKNAELLHKALYSYQVQTQTESDKERWEYQNRDLFQQVKNQVFQQHDLTKYLEWKADYESRLMEEKYYTYSIISEAKDLQNSVFAEAAKTGNFVTSFDYLLDTLAFASFDQTLSDILDFLKFEIWKIIEKNSEKGVIEKNSEKGIINFKNIHIVVPDILHNINAIEHLKMIEREDWDSAKIELKKEKIKKGKEVSAHFYTTHMYRPIEWQHGRLEVDRKLVDVNLLNSYNYDSGIVRDIRNLTKWEGYKDTFKRSRDYYFYHGTRILCNWAYRIKRRSIKFTNIEQTWRKKYKINTNSTLVYINHIRWSWTQWLGYDITEIEDDFHDNNLVILNERYRLWFLKRGPIRVKLPVVLKIKEDVFKSYFIDRPKKGLSILERDAYRVHILGYTLEGQLQDSLNWKNIRLGMEKYYQKDIVNIIFEMAGKGFSKREAKKLNESEQKILAIDAKHMNMFLRNCYVNHKLLYSGFASYSIDLIRYGDIWFYMDEEFDYGTYFTMKQVEFIVHDPMVDEVIKRVQGIALTKYRPESYAFFYKRFFKGKLYTIYSIGYYFSIIAILDVLFYKPGIYISNIWVLIIPIIFAVFFRVLRKYVKEDSERKRGADVYLYKYQSFEQKTSAEIENEIEKKRKEKEASADFIQRADVPAKLIHYDTRHDKVEESTEAYVPLYNQYDWWRKVSHLNKNNPIHLFRVFSEWVIYVLMYFLFDMWQSECFRVRISEGLWFWYRLEEGLGFSYVPGTRWKWNDHAEINYKRRTWEYDSWTRFEQGGNVYSRWYVNRYNMRQNKDLVELDYGYAAQKVDVELPFHLSRDEELFVQVGYADIYWFDTCETYLSRTRWDDWDLTEYGKLIKPFRNGKAPDGNLIFNLTMKVQRQKINYFEVEDTFWGFLKADFRGALREFLLEHLLGANFRLRGYEPLLKFIKFQKRMEDEYGYSPENIHSIFVLEAKKETEQLISADIARYYYADRNLIFQTRKKIQEFYKMRWETYKDVNSIMDIKIRGTITENEKHLHNLFYNFIKCKIKRYELLLESPEYQKIVNKDHDRGFKEIYDELKQKEDILFNKKLEMEIAHNENIVELEKIKKKAEISALKYEHYINKINKKVSFEEAIEYKSRLLSKLWKEKDWLVIEDLFRNYTGSKNIWEYLLEFVYVLLDFISKI